MEIKLVKLSTRICEVSIQLYGVLLIFRQSPSSLLVESRKRLTDDILGDINEMIIDYNTLDDDPPAGDSGRDGENSAVPTENKGTLILYATCAPQKIAFPQDINLLNEARENLKILVDDICNGINYYKPRV